MKRTHRLILAALCAGAAAPASAQTSLTIYNDGRVLMRRTLPGRIPAGDSEHRLALGALDPGSLFSLEAGVTLLGAAYDAAVDEANTMRRAVGRMLVFETGRMTDNIADTVVVEVLGVEPDRFRLPDGRVTFQRPGRPRYPAELIQIEPTLTVSVRSRAARDGLPLGWFRGGASWSAAYQVLLGPNGARIEGSAVIPSDGLSVDSAEVQLLAGEVGRVVQPPMGPRQRLGLAAEMRADAGYASEETVGEVHLYSLPARVTLRPGVTTTNALFQPATAPYERRYVVRGQIPWYGPFQQEVGEQTPPVEVHYVLERPRNTEFGDRPLPAGVHRIYEPDGQGRAQLVGEASGGHTAAGQPLRLRAGDAFDITARRVQTEYTTRRDTVRGSLRTLATVGYRVTIANAKDSAVTVEVLEQRRGEWRVLDSSLPAERVSATETRFRVRVPAQGEATLTYRVQVVW